MMHQMSLKKLEHTAKPAREDETSSAAEKLKHTMKPAREDDASDAAEKN